jgi:hypothetical protein
MSSIPHHVWRCHISHQLALPSFQLTPSEVKSLLQLREARRTPQAVAKRAQIVLTAHAHPDWSSQQLAQSLGLKARLIRKWRRRRWSETHSLQDAPRLGAPRRFSSEVRAQVTALACGRLLAPLGPRDAQRAALSPELASPARSKLSLLSERGSEISHPYGKRRATKDSQKLLH